MTAFFLLQIGRVQQVIAQTVVNGISDKIQSEVKIGAVDYKIFNTISLENVYVEDLHADTLLYVGKLNAHFNLFRFFTGKVIFYSVEFDGLQGNIRIDENGENNFNFLVEAFSNPGKEPSSNELEYRINRFHLKNSSLRFTNYKNQGFETEFPKDKINFSRLFFDKINADISLNVLNKDTLSARIANFSGEEQSGLKLEKLTTEINASTTRLDVPYFHVLLPYSKLELTDISLNYDSIGDFADFSKKILLSGKLQPSFLKLDDIGSLIPELKGMNAVAKLEAGLSGRFSSLRVQDIKVEYGESFVLNGNLDLNGLPDLQQTFVYGNLEELSLNAGDTENFLSDLMREPFNLPDELRQLGTARYKGNISGFFSNLVIYGNLKTNAGSLSTDILLQLENNFHDLNYNGTIKSSDLNLGQMLMSDKVGNIAFSLNTTGSVKKNSSFQGVIDANVPELSLLGYKYEDIRFDGKYDGNGFNGKLLVEDENVNIRFNGLIDLTQELPVFDFDLAVKETNLHALHLTTKYPESILSFNGKTSMTGNSMDNINGFILFDSIVLRNGDKILNVDEMRFTSRTEKNYTNFSIASNYINGSISGNFKYTSLAQTSALVLQKYLPALNFKPLNETHKNSINIDLAISNTEDIAEVFELPYSLTETMTIKGVLDESKGEMDIVAAAPKIIYGSQGFNNSILHIWGEKEKLEVVVESNLPTQNDFWNVALYSTARNDSLITNLEWRNRQQVANRGDFKTLTKFLKNKDSKLTAATSILPSEIVISDSLWNVKADEIEFAGETIHIDNFLFDNERQHLSIDGVASKSRTDSLNIEIMDVNLDFISSIANMKGFHIGGITTGKALVLGALERPVFDVILAVKDFTLNRTLMGDVSIFSTWDQINEQLIAIASINNETKTTVLGECAYTPATNLLDITLDANRLNLDFLSGYYKQILPNTTGFASGKMHIGGPLNEIRFDGRLMVNDGQVTVGALGSSFHFNDTIVMTPTSIEFPDITLYDAENNKTTLNGALTHNGMFKDFNFNLNVQAQNALVANLNPGDNQLFFGKAYADASVRISGDEEEVNIRVNALTRPGTKIFIQAGMSSSTIDAGFIQFVKHEEEHSDIVYTPRIKAAKISTNLKLDLQIEATPAAEIELIIDPAGGDMISGKGNGNVRIQYDSNQSDAQMYGSYTIESGKYLFTLQEVFRKEFKIEAGSTVHWTGSPSNAQVNIKAIYSLTASLQDLIDEDMMESVLSDNIRMTVPVSCVLMLTDNLMSPTITFDITLPSSDERVRQVVKNVINTNEVLTTQILYLLVFNKFYMPDNPNAVNLGNNDFLSLTMSTVSAQLNNLISRLSNTFSFGLGMRQVNEVDMEYQVDLLYQPNDRWIVNGNFGYRQNNKQLDNYNQYITDVDIEYLLTELGKLRFKVYNHTIDRTVQLRTAKNTQGVGFVYKENFDSVLDMFRYYWRALINAGKKNKKIENEDSD